MCRMCVLAVALFPIFLSGSLGHKPEDNAIPTSVQEALEKSDQFELLSLKPEDDKSKHAFHGWKVLGKTEVKDATTRKALLSALKKGVEENKGEIARCFDPRHAIRATYQGKTTDLVICFECLQVKVFVGDKNEKGFLVSHSPEETFDRVLKQAGVPLAEKRKN